MTVNDTVASLEGKGVRDNELMCRIDPEKIEAEMKRQYTEEYYGSISYYHKTTFKYFSRSISMASYIAILYRL
jgi:hypothetical protein